MEYSGLERRKYPRMDYNFVVSYRVLQEENNVDITQSKNISLGGMWLTTNRKFAVGAKLVLKFRLPLYPDEMVVEGRVVDSKEVVTNLIYDTHLAFTFVDEKYQKTIGRTVDDYLNNQADQEKLY